MTTDTALIEKREELKRRLAAGEYKTLVDIFLEWFDRLIRRITRRTKPLPIWFITVILILAVSLISFAVSYIADDLTTVRDVIESAGLGYRMGALVITLREVLGIVSPIALNQYINRIFVLWRDDMIDATESVASLETFEDWLVKTSNRRLHLLVTIIGGFLFGLYFVKFVDIRLSLFVGYGTVLLFIIISMFSSAFVYLLWMVVLLSARLRRYDLKLFASDPSSSELLFRLASELSLLVYIVAVYAAFVTLVAAWSNLLTPFVVLLISALWLPIILLFILNQTSLSSIIRRAKWKTLNEIQAKVEKLQAAENFEDKETMEAINRLMAYHNQVKATRNSAIDLGTILHFINSLLLPWLAFLLGNLDKLISLLPRRP